MADIESMFYQVRVPERHRSFLRFLWWDNGNLDASLSEYQMCVHLFGGISSPSCANFALRRAAEDFESKYGQEARLTLERNFYVDDLLKSTDDVESAITVMDNVIGMCQEGGFKLNKFISNNLEVLKAIPEELKAADMKIVDMSKKSLSIERALGVAWRIENYTLGFHILLDDKPCTRRGILSTISSIYDPLGLAGPFLLKGKMILQEITVQGIDWDEMISQEQKRKWEQWRYDLPLLQTIEVNRCYKPDNFGVIKDATLHSFSDACYEGYGQASYLRQVNDKGDIHVSLVMGKSRVSPIKSVTIPRLELTAASVSAKVGTMVKEELEMSKLKDVYWTDSQIVLGYIRNEHTRFRVFVANRIQNIISHTEAYQWRYVESNLNPADHASRGITLSSTEKVKQWFNAPNFLWLDESLWPVHNINLDIMEGDPELIQPSVVNVISVVEENGILKDLSTRISCWYRLKRVFAIILKFCNNCKQGASRKVDVVADNKRKPRGKEMKEILNVNNMVEAENLIIKLLQKQHFWNEYRILDVHPQNIKDTGRAKRELKGGSPLLGLNPFIDKDGMIRVGGRLENSSLPYTIKFPVILPKGEVISDLIIRWCHYNTEHGGRGLTLNEVRNNGYWIICGNSKVRRCIHKCVPCRRFRGKLAEQKMADLPVDRTLCAPPFTYTGVDMFGPFVVKQGRKEVKRYGALFTCLASRAVHIETADSMSTDSFINSLRRFIGRRGNVHSIRSDNGSNFVGADNELKKAISEMDHNRIHEYLLKGGTDWIIWKKNPPTASHMGGVWERQIRSIRAILESMLRKHGHMLDDEALRTLMVEAEAIINSRPLTVETLSDPTSCLPISAAQLLTQKSKVILAPPGEFVSADMYCRRRWRRVQYLANEFWSMWRKGYLNSLQMRQKWNVVQRNFEKDDIVLLKDESSNRNCWPMGRIIETFPDNKGIVRHVKLLVKSATGDTKLSMLKRPISKLVLLLEVSH